MIESLGLPHGIGHFFTGCTKHSSKIIIFLSQWLLGARREQERTQIPGYRSGRVEAGCVAEILPCQKEVSGRRRTAGVQSPGEGFVPPKGAGCSPQQVSHTARVRGWALAGSQGQSQSCSLESGHSRVPRTAGAWWLPEASLGAAEPRGRGEGSSSWHRFDIRLELPALPTRNSTLRDGTS